jgi:hypothetical protein
MPTPLKTRHTVKVAIPLAEYQVMQQAEQRWWWVKQHATYGFGKSTLMYIQLLLATVDNQPTPEQVDEAIDKAMRSEMGMPPATPRPVGPAIAK